MAGKVLATELGGAGVRVNSVSPTVVLTEMGTRVWGDEPKAAPMLSRIANGHFAQPEDVASAVAFLLGEGADDQRSRPRRRWRVQRDLTSFFVSAAPR